MKKKEIFISQIYELASAELERLFISLMQIPFYIYFFFRNFCNIIPWSWVYYFLTTSFLRRNIKVSRLVVWSCRKIFTIFVELFYVKFIQCHHKTFEKIVSSNGEMIIIFLHWTLTCNSNNKLRSWNKFERSAAGDDDSDASKVDTL